MRIAAGFIRIGSQSRASEFHLPEPDKRSGTVGSEALHPGANASSPALLAHGVVLELVLPPLCPVPTSQQACAAGHEASWVGALRNSAGEKRCETGRSMPYVPQSASAELRTSHPPVTLKPEATKGQSRTLPFMTSPLPLTRWPREKAPMPPTQFSSRSRISCCPKPRGQRAGAPPRTPEAPGGSRRRRRASCRWCCAGRRRCRRP
jgi:hypothetical protein